MQIVRKQRPLIAQNITELIGNTPLLALTVTNRQLKTHMIAKLESFNPLSSVKDRIALSMINAAEKEGKLKKGDTIIEATSGNTGIGLAWVAKAKGYNLVITMPETMSEERKTLLRALGVELILTDGKKGMPGAIAKSDELTKTKGYFQMGQMKNPANPDGHRDTTALEIFEETSGKVDIFVAGVGTGGTITGVGETLKKLKPSIQIIAVEPASSAVLSGESPGPHPIQGIGAGFVPPVLNRDIIDEIVTIKDGDAGAGTRELLNKEGVFVGISSGAVFAAAKMVASREENRDKIVVLLLADSGERYLSTPLFTGEK
ncbi:cysteine synthase A [bacterium]|nr:cysteine synthase A [bacterium]